MAGVPTGMSDVIDTLRAPQPLIADAPVRIAVASGKGGVGKTWLAISLAQAIAEAGRRVLLVDGDFGLANLDVQLGLTPALDLAAVLGGRATVGQAIIRFAPGSFDILPGRSGSGALSTLHPARLEGLLIELADQPQDVMVLDLGAGLDAGNRRLACWADKLLVVATDEPTSLTDAYAVLKLHAADCARAAVASNAFVVVNQAGSVAAGQRTFATLARACAQFLGREPHLAGIIRRDDHVRETIRRQTPLLVRHPTCAAAQDVRVLAGRLLSPHICALPKPIR